MTRKHISILIMLLMTVNLTVFSQQGFRIDTMYIVHNNERVLALKSTIEPNVDFVKKETINFYSDHFKISFKGKNELVAKEVLIPEISTKRMNFYILIESDNFGSTVYNYAQLGFDIYIDTLDFKEEFHSMNLIFNDYISSVLSSYYKLEIKNLRKDISKQNKKRKQLLRRIKKLDKKITKNTKAFNSLTLKEIATEDDIQVFESKQLELKSKIKEYTTEKQYSNQKLELIKKDLKRLASELEIINFKLQQLTSTKIIL